MAILSDYHYLEHKQSDKHISSLDKPHDLPNLFQRDNKEGK